MCVRCRENVCSWAVRERGGNGRTDSQQDSVWLLSVCVVWTNSCCPWSRRMAVDITPAPSLPPSLPVCDECVSLVCVHTNTRLRMPPCCRGLRWYSDVIQSDFNSVSQKKSIFSNAAVIIHTWTMCTHTHFSYIVFPPPPPPPTPQGRL